MSALLHSPTAAASPVMARSKEAIVACRIDDVLITDELVRRAPRPPDYEAEARAFGELAAELAANPRGLLQKVVDMVLTLCRADSAGVSILEAGGAHGIFRWRATAGAFAANLNGTMPREASPCGDVLLRNDVLLFDRPQRYFAALSGVEPPIFESLLAPWGWGGEPIGTVWALGHTPERRFDHEDARLISSLARFAAAVWQAVLALDEANARREETEREIEARMRELEIANAQLRRAEEALEGRVRGRTLELGRANEALEAEIRERRLAEEQIRSLLRRLITIQEEERSRFARNLQDQLGQPLTALRMSLESLRSASGERSRTAAMMRIEGLAEDLDRSIDFLAWQLKPAALEDLGLAPALGHLVRGWSARFGVAAEYLTEGIDDRRFPSHVEANLYRLAQEALHNVYKHADARRVRVTLAQRDGRATLVIEDDGRGFEASAPPRQPPDGGIGLVGMRERARLAGGQLDVRSSPGAGTTIRVVLPFDPAT